MKDIPDSIYNSGMCSYKKTEHKDLFNNARDYLNEVIDEEIEKENNVLRLNVLKVIRDLPDYTEDDFEVKNYVYNDGNFRTEEELKEYDELVSEKRRREDNIRYYNSGQYQKDCKQGSFFCWLPPIIDVGIFLLCFLNIEEMAKLALTTVFLFPVSLIISAIIMSNHSKNCLKIADAHDVPLNDPTVKKHVNNIKTLRLGAVATAITAYHETKVAHDSLSNPDTWHVF